MLHIIGVKITINQVREVIRDGKNHIKPLATNVSLIHHFPLDSPEVARVNVETKNGKIIRVVDIKGEYGKLSPTIITPTNEFPSQRAEISPSEIRPAIIFSPSPKSHSLPASPSPRTEHYRQRFDRRDSEGSDRDQRMEEEDQSQGVQRMLREVEDYDGRSLHSLWSWDGA